MRVKEDTGMFLKLFGYRLKRLINDRAELFWLMIFPLILGTFFYATFSGISEKSESIGKIRVALINEGSYRAEQAFTIFWENISGEEGIIENVSVENISEARDMMTASELEGIVIIGEDISIEFADEGIYQTILKKLINRYMHTEKIIVEKITDAVEAGVSLEEVKELSESIVKMVYSQTEINRELSLTEGNMDTYAHYFFALMAMTTMFGSTYGLINTKEIQANQSKVAARRCVSPTKKSVMVISDFFAAFVVIYMSFIILFVYLNFILGIDFGNRYGYIMLAGLVASLNGIALGYLIGVGVKAKYSVKNSIMVTTVLSLNFMAGLMMGGMKYYVEKSMPWFNRINPAALISDSFESLGVFGDMDMYYRSLITLLAEAAVFIVVSIAVLRKEKMESI